MAKLTIEQRNSIWRRYAQSQDYSLSHVYGRYSHAKERAWEYCVRLMQKYNGNSLRILSHNTFMFTCAFEFEDSETGEVHLMHITPSHDTII